MRIGELAERTGVSIRSLRYYEAQRLLVPERTDGGHRVYVEAAVDRVRRIQELLAAGLSSKKIAELLPCMRDVDGGPTKCADPRLVETLINERDRMDHLIADLRRSRRLLNDVIDAAVDLETVRTVPTARRAVSGFSTGTTRSGGDQAADPASSSE